MPKKKKSKCFDNCFNRIGFLCTFILLVQNVVAKGLRVSRCWAAPTQQLVSEDVGEGETSTAALRSCCPVQAA